MRLALIIGLMSALPMEAEAECLAPGKMPAAIQFSDGSRQQGITLTDGLQDSEVVSPDGKSDRKKLQFGFYVTEATMGEELVRWDWGGQAFVAAQDLPVAEDTVFDQVTVNGADAIRVTFSSKGPEELRVGDCTYTVIHLTERIEMGDAGSIAGDLWIEPENMLMLGSVLDRLDASGAPIDHRERMAAEISP